MSTLSNTTMSYASSATGILSVLATRFRRWLASYISWRLEATAHLMSDRELKDIGISRSQTQRVDPRALVIALHCSGAGAAQWGHLVETLGGGYEVAAPEHYGSESTGPWGGEHAFTLADEAARAIALIDETEGKVHLVGHSYGGAVALHLALARSDRIASLALYEASAFHLLRQMGEAGSEASVEIAGIAQHVCRGIVTGDYRGAMAAFVDYWSGPGAWDRLRPTQQAALVRWAPKAPLDFKALIDEPTPAEAYSGLGFPVLILRGERAPAPTRLIARVLQRLLPQCRLLEVEGAGHMGPLTHADQVSVLIARHIESVEANASRLGRARWRPRCPAEGLDIGAHAAEAVS
jgi:pimeloyl-ACP methyl ester carboxylesterase